MTVPGLPRRPKLTGRTMLISAMALFLLVILASPVQTYFSRRASVGNSERQQQQLDAHVAQLQAQAAQWKDPAFVEREARARLQYIRPGDTLYTVLNPAGQPLEQSTSATGTTVVRTGHQTSWNSTLWSSVSEADSTR